MTLDVDVALEPDEIRTVRGTDPRWWFTHVRFRNSESPRHPGYDQFEPNNRLKQAMVRDWIEQLVPGRTVLDTFCANGAFSFEAARVGASDVLGVDFDRGRIACARMVADLVKRHGWRLVPHFEVGDAYELPKRISKPYQVTLCLGGLYHVPDPVLVLKHLRRVTEPGGHLILQTSEVMRRRGPWAKFRVHEVDRKDEGLSSLGAKTGRWKFTRDLVDRMLCYADFEVIEGRVPSLRQRARFPWYCALAKAN